MADLETSHATLDHSGLPGVGSGDMVKLDQIVVTGSPAADVTFSAISGAYETLIVEYMVRSDRGSNYLDNLLMQLNSDTGSNYDDQDMQNVSTTQGNYANYGTTSAIVGQSPAASATANVAGAGEIIIPAYARTVFYKTWTAASGNAAASSHGVNYVGSGTWHNTAAITAIKLFGLGNFAVGSVFTLYGLS